MGPGHFTRGSARMSVGTFMPVCSLARISHAHRHTHTDTRTQTHTHTHTHTHTLYVTAHTYTDTDVCSSTHICMYTPLHTHLYVYTSTHICMHLCMYTPLMCVFVVCVSLCARARQALHDPRQTSTQRQRCKPHLSLARARVLVRAPFNPSSLPI